MTLFAQYVAYGEHQAQKHPLINHRPSVVGGMAFDCISQSDVEAERREGVFRTAFAGKGFYVRWIVFNGDTEATQVHNAMIDLRGGFYILKKVAVRTDKANDITSPLGETFEIGSQILHKMVADSMNGHPLFMRSVDRLDALNAAWQARVNIGQSSDLTGWLFTFSFRRPVSTCLINSQTAWIDGGKTPY